MKLADAMKSYDYDLPLLDALNDRELSPDRRVLAGALIGEALDKAYLSVGEMEEAFATLANDVARNVRDGEGRAMIEAILRDRVPLQMRLWYALHETELTQAAQDLAWLKALAYRRGRMTAVMQQASLPPRYWTTAEGRGGPTAAEIVEAASV